MQASRVHEPWNSARVVVRAEEFLVAVGRPVRHGVVVEGGVMAVGVELPTRSEVGAVEAIGEMVSESSS